MAQEAGDDIHSERPDGGQDLNSDIDDEPDSRRSEEESGHATDEAATDVSTSAGK